MVSLISNTAALNAQSNLQKANFETQGSIARLSSGDRINRPAVDVAGLAVGTILKTNVSTLRAALSNTSQAKSLLGVADGALKNIGELLQRQKALASQATSGSLSESARGFLDQEFQAIVGEIDRTASNTNFNGIKLIDGSLFAPSVLTTESKTDATGPSGVLTFVNAMANNNTVTINGVTFTFATNPTPADLTTVALGGAGAADATALMDAITNIQNSVGDTHANDRAGLAGLSFSRNGADITITSLSAGTSYNDGNADAIQVTGGGGLAAADITVNGNNAGAAAVSISNGGTAGTDSSLNAGSFATGGNTAYSGTTRSVVQGNRGDNIITAIDTTAAAVAGTGGNATGFSAKGVSNNPSFIGTIQGFTADYIAPNLVNVSVKVGNFTYEARNINTNPGAANIVRFTAIESGGGYFDIQFDTAANSGFVGATKQSDADLFANRLNAALSTTSVYQDRDIDSYQAFGTIFPAGSTTASGDLSGSSWDLITNDFKALRIEDIRITNGTSDTDAVIEVDINGETFRSGFDAEGVAAALGTQVNASTTISLKSITDPNKMLQFTNGGTALQLTTAEQALAAEKAFKNAFGVGKGGTQLSFQVGTTADDNISLGIENTSTESIYLDTDGTPKVLDIKSIGDSDSGAIQANNIIDLAIQKVTSLRADIGALQSRFDFASANIEASIFNQDAARSTFLDANVAQESTDFAGAQVRLQASISVLAQANQIPQSLLKLIG